MLGPRKKTKKKTEKNKQKNTTTTERGCFLHSAYTLLVENGIGKQRTSRRSSGKEGRQAGTECSLSASCVIRVSPLRTVCRCSRHDAIVARTRSELPHEHTRNAAKPALQTSSPSLAHVAGAGGLAAFDAAICLVSTSESFASGTNTDLRFLNRPRMEDWVYGT